MPWKQRHRLTLYHLDQRHLENRGYSKLLSERHWSLSMINTDYLILDVASLNAPGISLQALIGLQKFGGKANTLMLNIKFQDRSDG